MEDISEIIENLSQVREKNFVTSIDYTLTALLNSKYYSKIDRIIVYGSFARGDYKADSDIDLIVLTNERLQPEDIRKIRSLIDEKTYLLPEVDLKFYQQHDKMDRIFSEEVKKDGVVLWKRK
ncbi:MAG TPA: nucleotidyltransferase domain-containing protein [Candidatus Limivivens merdigallinarum]|uniref:Nucleotidyltransferase domain-containing protein n=1 Tax=Candidatus Limivivens merdigallinarum TaxID=2840859 RepID=A0A9D1D0R2_9FIRM|nr:nucleotidyltransferase domain-containing protein [Candidatus Limivivens merdigallinarum]